MGVECGFRIALSGQRLFPRGFCGAVVLLTCLMLAGTGKLRAQSSAIPATRAIIVAVEERPDPALAAGSTQRGYGRQADYSGSARTRAIAAGLARDHGLVELSAWVIDPLHLRCMVYAIAASSDRAEVLSRLRSDRRVALAQELQEFDTLSTPSGSLAAASSASSTDQYNDPYVALQTGFASIGAGQAQRLANGEGVGVALIDTGVDSTHPDLKGRIRGQRDFVNTPALDPGSDRHGTEVAGVIAAVANNGVGIVGVAPAASLHAFRACWPLVAGRPAARCNSFTLAQALGAAIDSDARIINLSLGGPHDPLLEQLLDVALRRGKIVVAATPADGRPFGFPSGVAGVIAVSASTPDPSAPGNAALRAPGKQILTLEPGGSYDYASGSSLAAAHVTGTVALLLQLAPATDSTALATLLKHTSQAQPDQIDACAAAHSVHGGRGSCFEQPSGIATTAPSFDKH
ncbi:S8 family serine peptidase [Dokdonella sp.]|uniref:S8 family peptidase n=1 Tax=Dokdonella sp. TaxID=2291710 RepID=UPI0035286D22